MTLRKDGKTLTIPSETFYETGSQTFESIKMDHSDTLEITVTVEMQTGSTIKPGASVMPGNRHSIKLPFGQYAHYGDSITLTNATYTYKVTIEPSLCMLGDEHDRGKVALTYDGATATSDVIADIAHSIGAKVHQIEVIAKAVKIVDGGNGR